MYISSNWVLVKEDYFKKQTSIVSTFYLVLLKCTAYYFQISRNKDLAHVIMLDVYYSLYILPLLDYDSEKAVLRKCDGIITAIVIFTDSQAINHLSSHLKFLSIHVLAFLLGPYSNTSLTALCSVLTERYSRSFKHTKADVNPPRTQIKESQQLYRKKKSTIID